LKNNTITYS